jgi:hypothetical protein
MEYPLFCLLENYEKYMKMFRKLFPTKICHCHACLTKLKIIIMLKCLIHFKMEKITFNSIILEKIKLYTKMMKMKIAIQL